MVKSRYIAFVGNLPFDTTEEELKDYFKCIGDLHIRMRHSKEGKFRGFAFVECENNDQFQKLLLLHHQSFKNRKVNIELSAGGGGNSNSRKSKISKKNQKLLKYRQKIFEKAHKPK